MKPINNFDKVQAAGAIDILPAGAYVCKIEKCTEEKNKSGTGTHLAILFDIAEGDYRGFFMADWKAQNREDKFWRGIIRQNVPDEKSEKYDMQCRFFKAFVNAVEDSNSGFAWDWDEAKLKGKLIGVVFREIEKQSQRGTVYTVTNADSICSVEAARAGTVKIPERKLLSVPGSPAFTPAKGPVSIDQDEDVPF